MNLEMFAIKAAAKDTPNTAAVAKNTTSHAHLFVLGMPPPL